MVSTLEAEARGSHDGRQLAEYLAASCLHCLDEWGFLAGASERLLAGHWPLALHLAYYAELRAAMSLLASLGIGVFNNYHISLDANLKVLPIKGLSTHKFVWAAFQRWAEFGTDMFPLGTIRVGIGTGPANSLGDWLNDVVGSSTGSLITANLLEAWSVDLQALTEDHVLRNAVSYRPTRLQGIAPVQIQEFCRAIFLLWQGCEPGGVGSYRELDRHLLRLALKKAFESQPKSRSSGGTLMSFVEVPLKLRRDEAAVVYEEELRFLGGTGSTSIDRLFDEASRRGGVDTPNGVLPVMARAVLLLRIAAAGCCFHLQNAGVTMDQARFWWESLGRDLGLWDSGGVPSRLEDLWDDVKAAVDLVEDDLNQDRFTESGELWDATRASALHQTTTFQKVGLWSLGLA